MVAPNTEVIDYNSLITATLRNTSSEIIDNISKHIPLIYRLKDKQNIKTDGGTEIVRNIRYRMNSNYSRIRGYQEFAIAPQESYTVVRYDYKQVVIAVPASDEEQYINTGKWKLFDLVERKIQDMREDLMEGLDADCYSDGTADGGNQIGGLQLLIADSPSSSTTVGGINQSTYSWWRNISKAGTADFGSLVSNANVCDRVRAIKHLCTRNKSTFNLGLIDNNFYDALIGAMESKQRFTSPKGLIDAGFSAVSYEGVDFINCQEADGALPANHNYFLNDNTLQLVIHKDRNFTPLSGDRTVPTQAAVVKAITFVGNLITTERRTSAVYINQ